MAERQSGDFIIKISKDLKDVDAWEGGGSLLLPNGRYNLEIVRITQKMDEGYVAPVVYPTFKVLDGEFEGQDAGPDQFSLAEQALGKFKQFMLSISEGKADHGTAFRSADIMHKRLSARASQEEVKGKPGVLRNRFDGYQPYDPNVKSAVAGGGAAPASGAKPASGAAPDQQITGF